MKENQIPIYSIDTFKNSAHARPYQIEVFDTHRHFDVIYPHKHDFFEILFLTKGSGIHEIDFIQHEIKENTIFFLSPGQVHNISTSDDVQGYILLFTSDFYLFNKQNKNKLLELPFFYNHSDYTLPLHFSNENEAAFITSIFAKGVEDFNLNDEFSTELIEALLDLILVSCERLYPKTKQISGSKGNLLTKRFLQLIEENYQQNLSVSDYAEFLNVSANHLTETVKKITGQKSNDLIKNRILLEAKKLLTYTDLTVSEVAFELNFKDQSYFSRVFKRYFGHSPQTFKKDQ